jgi:cytochrome c553
MKGIWVVIASISGVIGSAGAAGLVEAPAGASSCSGCHATSRSVDTPVPRLIGRDAIELAAAMQAFKSGQRPATVMDRIAKGFSEEEIRAICTWYATQKD